MSSPNSGRVAPRIPWQVFVGAAAMVAACNHPIDLPPPFENVDLRLPGKETTVRFAVIGDTGTGKRPQYEIARVMAGFRKRFPFDLVLMAGDNLYGFERPADYERKFEKPYQELLEGGVRFYAARGNHDEADQRLYEKFNMDGKTYYSHHPSGSGVRFFFLDSSYMDRAQLDWIRKELADSNEEWKVCVFHHPLYSSGRAHGPSLELREVLEPVFVEHGVDVVFAGHEHFYERTKPQKGIVHFIVGASATVRKGNIQKTDLTARGYDRDLSFLLAEVDGEELRFQAVSRTGETVDEGVLRSRKTEG